jgi:hypothetical protein
MKFQFQGSPATTVPRALREGTSRYRSQSQEEVKKKEADRLGALGVAEAARKSAQDAEAKLAAEAARASLAAREEDLRKAEQAKRVAEADELRKVEEAKRLEELNAAREEARKAQEEVKKNEADHPAALKADEDAPKGAQGTQAKLEVESVKTAALESNVPDAAPTEPEALIRVVQTELKRVGCYFGGIDGQWGDRSREPLADFAGFTKLTLPTDEPTSEALQAIAGQKSRVCPLQCSGDEREVNGRCVARTNPNKPTNPNKLGTVKHERKDFGGVSQAKNSDTSSTKAMKQIEDRMRRTATGVAAAFGATADVYFPDVFTPLVNLRLNSSARRTSFATEVSLRRQRTLLTCSMLALASLQYWQCR